MWYIHNIEYYLVIKRNEVLICATAWVNLENSMQSKRSQAKKKKKKRPHCAILIIVDP